MKRQTKLVHKFVQYIPEKLEEGTIYISIEFGTVAHKCCCGCGKEVVTPLTPTDWKLTYDGDTVSLYPSIGNWSFPCKSHYWIERNVVKWSRRWTRKEIETGRNFATLEKQRYFDGDYSLKIGNDNTRNFEQHEQQKASPRNKMRRPV